MKLNFCSGIVIPALVALLSTPVLAEPFTFNATGKVTALTAATDLGGNPTGFGKYEGTSTLVMASGERVPLAFDCHFHAGSSDPRYETEILCGFTEKSGADKGMFSTVCVIGDRERNELMCYGYMTNGTGRYAKGGAISYVQYGGAGEGAEITSSGGGVFKE